MSTSAASAADRKQYFCYQCEHNVTMTPPSSPTAELFCPNCNGTFLEELETAPPLNPIPNPFENMIFSPSPANPGAATFTFSSGGFDDLSSRFGVRSPNEFNPFAFLNNYVNNLQGRGANIQLVFESPAGEGGFGGGGVDFRFPTNLGDYFIGPGLEQLIQQLAENDPNRYGTPPASKSVVEALPLIKINEEMMASDSSQCAVCKDSFELNEEAKQMPCKHIYHKDCILPWLELHNSCPVCRYELPTDDPDYENRGTGQMNDSSIRSSNTINLGFGAAAENQEGNNDNRREDRRFRVYLPWLLREFGSPAETSHGNGGGNDSTNNSNDGTPNNGSGAGGWS